jgi:protein-S-isoprenylcysteine O-methyltransferase Ste14
MNGRRPWGVWGVGPRIVMATAGCFVLLLALGATFPALRIGERPPEALATLAGILMAVAVVVWIVVIREVRPAHFAGRLVTGGLFAHVRNPIYSAFIFLECPGLALLLWSWPGLALPLVAYALYRRWIPLEEARLQQRFGAEYAAYRRRVPGLAPRLPSAGRAR